MCGISAVIYKTNPDWSLLTAMHHHQHMRGPDSQGAWISGNVGIMHNRLAIVDLSNNGAQPMESDRYVLAYNGEIYNHMALRNQLGPMQWKGHSDTETLLACIEHRGVDWALDNVDGMFAFVLWDKSDSKFVAAVDHLSIKPLYYFECDEYLAIASSPGALTHCKSKWELDLDALRDYLSLGATLEPLFKGMKKLMPGQMIKDGKIKTWYTQKHYKVTDAEVLDAVKESIRSVKVADVPVFMFLSGGIDSTVVASQCFGMPAIHLFSPEKQYAEQVAIKYNNQFHNVSPSEYSAEECLRDYSFKSGDCSMAAIIPYMVSKEVAKFGKVAISANGADELFFGYDRTHERKDEKQINHIFRRCFFENSGYYSKSWLLDDARLFELNTYVAFDLNKTLDFAAMCHGLEVRVPYLNRSVIEKALSIDRSKHVKGKRTKAILKEFLKNEGFDDKFVDRPKVGFSLFQEPNGHNELKAKGIKFLKDKFGIELQSSSGRDIRYYESSAAAFYVWYQTWENKL